MLLIYKKSVEFSWSMTPGPCLCPCHSLPLSSPVLPGRWDVLALRSDDFPCRSGDIEVQSMVPPVIHRSLGWETSNCGQATAVSPQRGQVSWGGWDLRKMNGKYLSRIIQVEVPINKYYLRIGPWDVSLFIGEGDQPRPCCLESADLSPRGCDFYPEKRFRMWKNIPGGITIPWKNLTLEGNYPKNE